MKQSLNNILVPVDLSKASLNAISTAIKMCKRHDATLHLLHVTSPEYFYPIAGMQAPVFTLAEEILKSEIDNLTTYANSIRADHKITCMCYNEVGGITSTVCKTAMESNCDVIVIGTSSNINAGGYLNRKVAYQILKESHCPVLTVPVNRALDIFRRVVFPVRPVLNATDKYDLSSKILSKNKSEVHIIGALETKDASKYSVVRRLVSYLENKLDNDKLDHSSEYHFARNIARNIIETSEKLSADLIVITASTAGTFKQLFRKNYTQQVMFSGNAAVLCIKPNIGTDINGFNAISMNAAI